MIIVNAVEANVLTIYVLIGFLGERVLCYRSAPPAQASWFACHKLT